MENKPEGVEDLFQKTKEYVEVQIDLFKLKGVNKLATSMASVVSTTILVIIAGAIFLCFTIGLSLLIGSWTGKMYYGFFIVGGVYLIAGLLIYLMRDKLIRNKITDKLIEELLN